MGNSEEKVTFRQAIRFWRDCICFAIRGSSAFANDWQWIFGIPLATGLSTTIATWRGVSELTTGHPIVDGIIAAFGAFLFTWLFAVFLRTLKAAPTMFFREKDRADQLTLEIQPKLKLSFDPALGCLVDSPVQEWFEAADTHKMVLARETRTIFARIRVDALSKTKVRECSAFLTEIETKQGDAFVRYPIHDPVQLDQGSAAETIIAPKVPRFWDFIKIDKLPNSFPVFPGRTLLTMRDIFKEVGTYRLKLAVVGEGVVEEIALEMHWNGVPDQISIREIGDVTRQVP
jgi:hypothetical protein